MTPMPGSLVTCRSTYCNSLCQPGIDAWPASKVLSDPKARGWFCADCVGRRERLGIGDSI